jgi:hypothetical protein
MGGCGLNWSTSRQSLGVGACNTQTLGFHKMQGISWAAYLWEVEFSEIKTQLPVAELNNNNDKNNKNNNNNY